MTQNRPKPEALLQRAQEEESREKRGKLKIYLGAAPGVGKTFNMLQDALLKRSQGLDVVVGVVETHQRKEIESMLIDLEILPRLTLEYHGRQVTEFNLEAALHRNPGLILIDEMAHTNIPNLRHAKRWQDIKEILDNGIDVYTTLNVQHVESLNDVVSQIIHTRVKETVPDYMLEIADTIELVDLPPEDLLKRLQEGKVYIPKQAELAAEHFFRKGNLIALRELALRVTAERVGEQVLLYRQGQGIRHIWPTREKILVCVGSRAESSKLIRVAKRVATKLQAEWIAVHVDVPNVSVTEEASNNVVQNLRLAKKLGAETQIIMGLDIVKEITNYAREQNATLIMVWKHIRPRWKDFLFWSLADELTRYSGEIDIYIVTSETDEESVEEKLIRESKLPKVKAPWRYYALSLVTVILATLLNTLLFSSRGSGDLVMVYLLGVIFISSFGKMGPSVFTSILSVIAYNFFLTYPDYTLYPTTISSSLTLLMMLLVSQVMTYITVYARQQVATARLVQHDSTVLHTLSRQLVATRGVDKLLGIAVRYLGEVFKSEVLALVPENDQLAIRAGNEMEALFDEKEQSVAQWVYELGQSAGLGTDTLTFSKALYVPLLASQGPVGVIRIRPSEMKVLSQEKMHLLESCANQIALALEVDSMHEQLKQSELQMNVDQMSMVFSKSVAHDIRTPLVAMMGAVSTLMEMGDALDKHQIKKLANEINTELEALSRLINNLLQIIYLESETIRLRLDPHSLENTIKQVLKILKKKIGKREIHTHFPADLPEVNYDELLLQDVLINLIENALKFTSPESLIEISVIVEMGRVVVSVEDRGPGIVFDEVNKLFEKFYRGRMLTTERGLGLGLAICYNIIKAHGGQIWAENRPGGGAIFRFTLLI